MDTINPMILSKNSTIKKYFLSKLGTKKLLKTISKLEKYEATPNAKKGAAIDK